MIKKVTLFCIAILTFTIIWRYPFTAPLSLDETLSAWVVSGSFCETFSRAFEFQGQSPFYFLALWGWGRIVGDNDLSYRLLSVILSFFSATIYYAIVKRLVSKNAALLSVLLLIAAEPFIKAATGVRPYGLGLFAVFLSIYAVLLLKEQQTFKNFLLYIVSLLLIWYSHYLFILAVLLHIFVVGRITSFLLKSWVVSAILAVPGIYHLYVWQTKKDLLSVLESPTLYDFAKVLIPSQIAVYFISALLLAVIAAKPEFKLEKKGIIISLVWWLSPLITLFVLSLVLNSQLFLDRYYLWNIGGVALFCGSLLSFMQNRRSLLAAIAVFTFLSFFLESQRIWQVHNWRDALEFVKGDRILAYSGLIEAENKSWLEDTTKREYLLAPFWRYGVESNLRPIGYSVTEEKLVADSPETIGLIALREIKTEKEFTVDIIQRKIVNRGYKIIDLKDFGLVRVINFRK